MENPEMKSGAQLGWLSNKERKISWGKIVQIITIFPGALVIGLFLLRLIGSVELQDYLVSNQLIGYR